MSLNYSVLTDQRLVKRTDYFKQGFSNVFFLFPSPPQKRGKERGAGWALPRPTGTTLFITLGWGGLLPSRATFEKPCYFKAAQEPLQQPCLYAVYG